MYRREKEITDQYRLIVTVILVFIIGCIAGWIYEMAFYRIDLGHFVKRGQGMGPWVHPIRVAVSGRGEGIGLFETCELLGKEKTVARLRRAANMI